MSFKSEAQRRKFKELVQKGRMTQAVYEEFERGTPKDASLPERVKKRPK